MWYKVNKIYVWQNQVRPTYKYLTYTLNQNQSNPASMITAVSDDAINMTQQQIIKFIWAYPVLLASDGTEFKKLNPNNFQQDIDWNDVSSYTKSSNYDVMICFPRRWYKLSTSSNITTFSLTNEPNNSEYCYAPFQRLSSWTLWSSSATYSDKDRVYIWAYSWYVDSNNLRSWYNCTPTTSTTIANFMTYARNKWSKRWIYEFIQNTLLQLYFLAMYKNTNANSVLWNWYVNQSWKPTTWVSTYNKWMTYWSTSNYTTPAKFLWVENRYGWVWNFVAWYGQNSRWIYISIPNSDWSNRSSFSIQPTWYTNVWTRSSTLSWYITKVMWSTYWWFIPTATWGSSTTYFPDSIYFPTSWVIAFVWWTYSSQPYEEWAFRFIWNTNQAFWDVWTRLMYLP